MEGFLGRFLSFDKMMAGSIIKILYYVGLVFIIIGGIIGAVGALFQGQFATFLIALIAIPLVVLFFRVICEMYIVVFRISDNLTALRKLKETEVETLNKFD